MVERLSLISVLNRETYLNLSFVVERHDHRVALEMGRWSPTKDRRNIQERVHGGLLTPLRASDFGSGVLCIRLTKEVQVEGKKA